MPEPKKANVATPSDEWNRRRELTRLVRLILGGTEAVWAAAGDGDGEMNILPKEKGEDAEEYKERKYRTRCDNFVREAIEEHEGLVFQNTPVLEADVPELIRGKDGKAAGDLRPWSWDIDLRGNDLEVFCRQTWRDTEADGRSYILVDKPPAGFNELVTDDEKRSGRRPFWTHIPDAACIDIQYRMVNGVRRVSLFRMEVAVAARKSLWGGCSEAKQIWVYYDGLHDSEQAFPEDHPVLLRLAEKDGKHPAELAVPEGRIDPASRLRFASFEAWEVDKNQNDGEPRRLRGGVMAPLKFIPVVPVVFDEDQPPLLSLAENAADYYRIKSDLRNIAHKACVPVLYRKNHQKATVQPGQQQNVIGAGRIFSDPPGTEGDMKYVEPSGTGVAIAEKQLDRIEERIKILKREPRQLQAGTMTATEVSKNDVKERSLIEKWLGRLVDALEQALDYTMQWEKKPAGQGGSLMWSREGLTIMPAGEYKEVRELRATSAITRETELLEGKRRGILHPDLDIKAEIAAVDQEVPKYGELDLEEKVRELEARLKALEGGKAQEPPVTEDGEQEDAEAA